MRVLIVKLSSLGDVVHAMPVVHDILAARPEARIDWVVDPAFAPLLRRVDGIGEVIGCALRRWSRAWWTAATRAEWRGFMRQLRSRRYDAVLDLQGLTKSAAIARLAHGVSHGLANRTDGASHEPPARWLVDHAIRIEPHVHAVDRSRRLAAEALGHRIDGPPVFGLRARVEPAGGSGLTGQDVGAGRRSEAGDGAQRSDGGRPSGERGGPGGRRLSGDRAPPCLVLVHGSSRADKCWPEAAWIALGRRAIDEGWRIALPRADAVESARAERLQRALGSTAEVWPALPLDAFVDRLGTVQGVIGVDSGPSHIAVALGLPHVQIYNFPTAWRTGPPAGVDRHQVAVEAQPLSSPSLLSSTPSPDAVWTAWQQVRPALAV